MYNRHASKYYKKGYKKPAYRKAYTKPVYRKVYKKRTYRKKAMSVAAATKALFYANKRQYDKAAVRSTLLALTAS